MNEILFLGIGLVVGYLVAKRWPRKASGMPEHMELKRENLEKLLAELSQGEEVTNNQVERMLGVSNATAERYLNELEKQGHLKQVGTVGRSVTYRKS